MVAQSDLSFGSIVVFGSGSRTVTASGSVIDSGLVPWGPQGGSPALFTVSYDRGNEGRRTLDLQIELVLSNVPPISMNGVSASVAGFDSSLPGAWQIAPGQPFSLRIPNCVERVCSVSFAIGGRLDVTRYQGGAELRFPLAVDATLVSVK